MKIKPAYSQIKSDGKIYIYISRGLQYFDRTVFSFFLLCKGAKNVLGRGQVTHFAILNALLNKGSIVQCEVFTTIFLEEFLCAGNVMNIQTFLTGI